MTRLSPDHLVVGAGSLPEGQRWLEQLLGLPPCGGGAHALMGTHNVLWRLDRCYLEVIAIDPEARPPGRPRWFGLDDPEVRSRLRRRPHLLTWVAATNHLAHDLTTAPLPPGEALAARRGALSWKIAVPRDGIPPAGGAFPALIEWQGGSRSPAVTLPDQGLSLQRLQLGLDDTAWAWLRARGIGAPVEPSGRPGLRARIGLAGDRGSIDLD